MRIVLENDDHKDEFIRQPLAEAMADILLEHERHRLPLNIGIFGAWGTGKTQFMRMICTEVTRKADPKPKTVWFKPWKYESRQDVGLGLLLAIIRAVENDKTASAYLKTTAQNVGSFVWKVFGKSAVAVADEVAPISAGTILKESFNEVRFSSPRIQTDIDDALDQLQELVSSWVGVNGRCFVFIDDLDRCLPTQMIALIEALHLYMVDTPCYFTVGVDREAISVAINDRYPRSDSELGRVYLDKIFATSVNLSPPTNTQLRAKYWDLLSEQELTEDQVNFVLEQLEQNPRSIERFINNYSLSRRLMQTKPRIYEQKGADLLILLTIIKTKFPDLFEVMQKVPREAVVQFVKHSRPTDPSRLKTALGSNGGNALLPFGLEGATSRAFVNSLPSEWNKVLEAAENLEKLLAYADV